MINALLNGIFSMITGISTAVLSPITNLINTFFPSTFTPLSYVSGLLNYLKQFVPFAFSYLGLSSQVLNIIVLLITAIIMIPIGIHVFKLAIRWYNALKP